MVRFEACGCGTQYLVRLNRDLWMRLFQTRRHYFCAKCKTRQFLPRSALVTWWVPRDAVRSEPPAAPAVASPSVPGPSQR